MIRSFTFCVLLALLFARTFGQGVVDPSLNVDPGGGPGLLIVIAAGENYTFTANGSGQVQWLKNGVPISGATTGSLTLTNAKPRDTGTYSFALRTDTGTSTSPGISLTVAAGYRVSTLAGKAGQFGAVDASGDAARFYDPWGIAVDAVGNSYVTDYANSGVRKVTVTGDVSTIATPYALRDPAVPSFSSYPEGCAVDTAGNVYIADGNAIRMIAPGGAVTTIAGQLGVSGSVNGNGTSALFQHPVGLAVDAQGNIFVSDYTQRIRKISPTRDVTTVAGSNGQSGYADGPGASARFNNPQAIAIDATGTLYVADSSNNCVRKIAPDGTVLTLAGTPGSSGSDDGPATTARFTFPQGIAVDSAGNVFVTDASTLRLITPSGAVTTIAGTSSAGASDGVGVEARFNQPHGVAVDSTGNVLISDYANSTIRMAKPDSAVVPPTTITRPPTAFDAVIDQPIMLSVTAAGAPPFTYQWLKNSSVISGATASTYQVSRATAADGGLYNVVVTGDGGAVSSNSVIVAVHDTPKAPSVIGFGSAVQMTAGSDLGIYVSVSGYPTPALQWFRNGVALPGETSATFTVKRAQASDGGEYTVQATNVAGQATCAPFPVIVNPKITNFVDSPADGRVAAGGTISFTVDATLGTTTGAYTWLKNGVPISGQSGATLTLTNVQGRDGGQYSVVVGNGSGSATSSLITLTVLSGYTVTTVASRPDNFGSPTTGVGVFVPFFYPEGLALDRPGSVYVADTNNNVIRKITPDGVVTTFAGSGQYGSVDGIGAAAQFYQPRGLAFDAAGNLYVADSMNYIVRKITPDGTVSTIAGSAGSPGSADGAAAAARFSNPRALAVGLAGEVFVADGNAIRKVAADGTVSTVLSANPADTTHRLSRPRGLAVDPSGNLLIADTGNYVVRKLSPAGALSIVAGQAGLTGATDGPVATARLTAPYSIAVDATGRLFIGDGTRLRILGTDGELITAAGSDLSAWANGTGAAAGIQAAYALAIDPSGAVYVMDGPHDAVRLASPPSYALYRTTSITTQPAPVTAAPGAPVTLNVAVDGTGPFTYQWVRDGTVLSGGTNATLALSSAQPGDTGTYSVVVTGAGGAVTSATAYVSVPAATRLTNLSIRSAAGSGAQTLVAGFVVRGGTKGMLIRGVGPALANYGVTGFLTDPRLGLYSDTTLLAQNDNWNDDANGPAIAAMTSRYTFSLPTNGRDAAMLKTLSDGAYTAQISSVDRTSGIGLVEMYDTGNGGTDEGRLINVSARTQVGTGDKILIAGFTISGPRPMALLIRGVGPGLQTFGVDGTLADPQIALYSGIRKLQENNDWDGTGQIPAVAAKVGAFPLAIGSKDAALLVALASGGYTVQLSGVGNTTGVALIEIYEVP